MKKKSEFQTSRCDMSVFYDMANYLKENTNRTLRDIFETSTKTKVRKPNNPVYIYEENGKTKTLLYKNYSNEVSKYGSAMSTALKGIETNSFIALKLSNSINWPLCFWGLVAAGYKPLLINPILDKNDTEKLLQEAGAKGIISNEENEYSVKSVSIKDLDFSNKTILDVEWANEVAFCTSGTTGDSRIYVYDGEALFNQIYSAYDMPKTTADIIYIGEVRLLGLVPLAHIFGFTALFLWYTFFGMTIVFPNSQAPEELVRTIKKYKCTHIYAVPLFFDTVVNKFKHALSLESEKKQNLVQRMIDFNNKFITATEAGFARSKLVRNTVQKSVFGNQVVFCISGGGALSKSTQKTMNGIGYNLYNGYGMTEIGVTNIELSPDVKQRNKGSVGKPLYGVEIKLDNKELCVKSPFIHKYRLDNGTALNALVDNDGYFHTGDIAEIDEQGNVFIKGKTKEVIIGSNGENIYPEEIEAKFKSLPFVTNLTIVGIINGSDEIVTLVVNVEKELNEQEVKELENSIKDRNDDLPQSMHVKQCLIAKESLPMNGSLKIKKYVLKEEIKDNPDSFNKLGNGISVTFEDFDEKLVKETVQHVIKIISDVLYVDINKVAPHSHISMDLGGDSFSYMSVVGQIENEFEITIPAEKIGRLNSASEFALYILKNKN